MPVLLLILLIPVVIVGSSCTQPVNAPPNIVLIVSDDQGCGDAAYMGNDRLQTPNLDRLTEEGMLLTTFHVAPVCAPTRAGLLTGRHHLRTGVRGVIEGREFMVGEEVTLAEILKAAGYRTALFGKWHLGETYPWLPHGQGFDEYIGFRKGSSEYFDVVLDDKGEPYPTEGYLTDVLTDLAIQFIDEQGDQPFFLYLPYNAPHGPLQVPDQYVEPYADLPDRTALVYGMMASLDENVGRLIRHLDDRGLSGDTIVLFFSDNGPLYGNRNDPDRRFNCGLRGQKYDVYEGGVRVPLTVRWPGRIPAGTRSDRLADHTDILPTLLDLAGVPLPDSVAIDGRSLRPILENESADWPERTLFMTYPGEQVKNRAETPYPGGMAITERYKMVDGAELYDLVDDPGETTNLAEVHPEVLRALDQAYRSFWTEASAEREPYPRPHVGHPEENPVRFSAHFADLSGGLMFQFGDDPPRYRSLGVHHDWIGKWETLEGRATWRLRFVQPGAYRMSLRMRCIAESRSPEMQIRVGDQSLEESASPCDGRWHDRPFGVLDLPAGAADVVASGRSIPDAAGIEIDQLIVERVDGAND